MNTVIWPTMGGGLQLLLLVATKIATRGSDVTGPIAFFYYCAFILLGVVPAFGALIGTVQWLVLRQRFHKTQSWDCTKGIASCLGWAIGLWLTLSAPAVISFFGESVTFHIPSLFETIYFIRIGWKAFIAWIVLGGISGVITGGMQGLSLPKRIRKQWVVTNVVGWILGLVGVQIANSVIVLSAENLHLKISHLGWLGSMLLSGLIWWVFGALFGIVTDRMLESLCKEQTI
ncbi:MAG: hypothetical protein U9R15_12990 [Chloroflexota bacterium]|nr:hypothetical protein [Chloroflexota bacterium]